MYLEGPASEVEEASVSNDPMVLNPELIYGLKVSVSYILTY